MKAGADAVLQPRAVGVYSLLVTSTLVGIRDSVEWRKLSLLYEEAAALDPLERATWLRGLGERDKRLASALERMLDAGERAARSAFLDELPQLRLRTETAEAGSVAGSQEERVGAYRLLQHIASGGTAEVWLASTSTALSTQTSLSSCRFGMRFQRTRRASSSASNASAASSLRSIIRTSPSSTTPELTKGGHGSRSSTSSASRSPPGATGGRSTCPGGLLSSSKCCSRSSMPTRDLSSIGT